jgi:hypothetical protein
VWTDARFVGVRFTSLVPMTIPRAVLLALLATDYHFENGHLIEFLTVQTAQLGSKLSDELSRFETPYHKPTLVGSDYAVSDASFILQP